MNSYHNTTNEANPELKQFEAKAQCQEAAILKVWKASPQLELTPERFETVLFNAPLTSIRRAFTNLARLGMIEKTGRKAPGGFGRNVNVWRLV